MKLYFDEDNLPDEKTAKTMQAAAVLAAEGEGVESGAASISVSFVDEDTIKELNGRYRNVDKVTDVLSFPAYESGEIPGDDELRAAEEGAESFGDSLELALGDVVICTDVAKRQAQEYGHSYERELIYLFVHSVFHLLGYDHETEDEKEDMRAREENVMNMLGIKR